MDGFAVMAVINAVIAAGYFVLATFLAPRLALPPVARYGASAFLVAAGLTEVALIAYGLDDEPAWLAGGAMFAIQGAQAVLLWGFIAIALRQPRWIERRAVPRETPEQARERAQRAEELALREHQIAETLQHSLLPDRLPQLGVLELAARYLPGGSGAEVGGDWYDVIELPTGEVALVMGDVVGRGIAAAALVGKLRNALRAYALEGHEPGDALERLNVLLDRDAMEMATLVYLVYQPERGTVRWVNAGHPAPLVRHADGSREFWEDGRYVPLGVLPAVGYRAASGRLEPGATLLLYTDGLIERPGVPLTATLDRLRAAATVNGSADALCEATLASMLPEENAGDDDVALLAAYVARHADGPLCLELSARPAALREVRRRLERWLAAAGVEPRVAGRVVLCANEATANAVQHAYGLQDALVWLDARCENAMLELRVRDEGHWREPVEGSRGRGLSLMRSFADHVDLAHDDTGTTVILRWRL